MVERICPRCQHGNPLENRFCGACGCSLDRNELAPRVENGLTLAGHQLPARQLRQVGQAMAVGLAALAAEVGLAWLKRRLDQGALPTSSTLAPLARASAAPAEPAAETPMVTIVSQRVVEIWEQGSLARQVVERHVWRKQG